MTSWKSVVMAIKNLKKSLDSTGWPVIVIMRVKSECQGDNGWFVHYILSDANYHPWLIELCLKYSLQRSLEYTLMFRDIFKGIAKFLWPWLELTTKRNKINFVDRRSLKKYAHQIRTSATMNGMSHLLHPLSRLFFIASDREVLGDACGVACFLEDELHITQDIRTVKYSLYNWVLAWLS